MNWNVLSYANKKMHLINQLNSWLASCSIPWIELNEKINYFFQKIRTKKFVWLLNWKYLYNSSIEWLKKQWISLRMRERQTKVYLNWMEFYVWVLYSSLVAFNSQSWVMPGLSLVMTSSHCCCIKQLLVFHRSLLLWIPMRFSYWMNTWEELISIATL